jgi:hypothetical protein
VSVRQSGVKVGIDGKSGQSKFNSLNSSCERTSPTQYQCSRSDAASVSSFKNAANVF